MYFKGKLLEKNTNLRKADKALTKEQKPWPQADFKEHSYYYHKFKQGASLVPRKLLFVEQIQKGSLGGSSRTPLIRGISSNQDKAPWKDISPLEGKMESQFLMPVYTGGSIAPFRVLKNNLAVIPWNNKAGVMSTEEAEREGWTNLSSYLEQAEKIWDKNGTGKMTFKENINFRNKLKNQFPVPKLRVVYAASGTYPAAVLLEDEKGIIDTSLYYAKVKTKEEGVYLEGILNSDPLIEKIRSLQAQGQWGARHFHRHLLKPYFPKYDSKEKLHKSIVSHTKKNQTHSSKCRTGFKLELYKIPQKNQKEN